MNAKIGGGSTRQAAPFPILYQAREQIKVHTELEISIDAARCFIGAAPPEAAWLRPTMLAHIRREEEAGAHGVQPANEPAVFVHQIDIAVGKDTVRMSSEESGDPPEGIRLVIVVGIYPGQNAAARHLKPLLDGVRLAAVWLALAVAQEAAILLQQ